MNSSEGPILVVAQSWVGDIIFSQMLYKELEGQQAQVRIDVAAPPWAAALLQRMPEVHQHQIVDIPHGRLKPAQQWHLAQQWRGQYAQAIIVPRSAKAALAPMLAGIPRRTGFASTGRPGLINDPRPRPDYIVDRMLALAGEGILSGAAYPCLKKDPGRAQAVMQRFGLDPKARWVGLMPGAAFGPAKQWGSNAFRELASLLDQHDCRVCVIGGKKEQAMGTQIAAASASIANLCGKTSLDEAVDLISALACAVCNDSGLLHVAAALDIPLVSIYGATSPTTNPPLNSSATVCYAQAPCSPCRKRRCPYEDHPCMSAITPAYVEEKVHEQMRQRNS